MQWSMSLTETLNRCRDDLPLIRSKRLTDSRYLMRRRIRSCSKRTRSLKELMVRHRLKHNSCKAIKQPRLSKLLMSKQNILKKTLTT